MQKNNKAKQRKYRIGVNYDCAVRYSASLMLELSDVKVKSALGKLANYSLWTVADNNKNFKGKCRSNCSAMRITTDV
jgi:hypothetical protein